MDKYDKNKIKIKSYKGNENATREISPVDFQDLPAEQDDKMEDEPEDSEWNS